MNNTVAILNLITGATAVLGPIALDLALKIKALFEQNQLGSVDIRQVGDAAIAADDAVMASVNEWLASHNLPPLIGV